MDKKFVRIAGIAISNFKNVASGKISLKNDQGNYKASVLGVYGQNGSGKTALIDTLELLKHVLGGSSIPNRYADYVSVDAETAQISIEFLIQIKNKDVSISYEFSLKKEESTSDGSYRASIFNESLKCPILSDKREKIGKFIDTCNCDTFNPKAKRFLLAGKTKEAEVDLMVTRKLTNAQSRSFIFSHELSEIIEKNNKNVKDNEKTQYEYYKNIIDQLADFGKHSLFVINTTTSGLISLNAQPISFRYTEKRKGAMGTIMLPLEEPVVLPQEDVMVVSKVVKNMNIVLQQLIPGLTISIKDLGTQLMEDGTTGSKIQLMSCKNSKEIPLKYESDGIKKIISVLQLLIVVYNQESITVAIDELDAGIFEYLLGELLRIISERGKGQLIFTSHNLRALETIDKQFLAFTTTNPNHRYTRMKNVKGNNNVRDMYYRDIMLGDESEELYERTKNAEISLAFREAGRYNGA